MITRKEDFAKVFTTAQLSHVAVTKVCLQLKIHEAVDRRGDGGILLRWDRRRHPFSGFQSVLNPVSSVPGILYSGCADGRQIQKWLPCHFQVSARLVSTSRISSERFGASDGSSGWKWDKGGVGMGGKESGNCFS